MPKVWIRTLLLLSLLILIAGCQVTQLDLFRPAWSATEDDPSSATKQRMAADASGNASVDHAHDVPPVLQRLPEVESSNIQQVAYTQTSALAPPETMTIPPEIILSEVADAGPPLRRSADKNLPPHPTLSPAIPAARGGGEGTSESADRLTLEELLQIAFANNPSVARAGAQVRALRGKWVQVGLPPNPTLGYIGGEMGAEGTAGQQGAYVGQVFVTAGKLHLNRAIAAQEVARAEQQLAATQQRVTTDVNMAFYDVLIAQRQIALARELVNISSQAVQISGDLLQAQEVSQVALLQTEVQAQDAQILLRRANNDNAAAWRRLSAVVGDPELPPRPLAGQLEDAAAEVEFEDLLGRLLYESPEMAAAASDLDRARWALRRACVEPRSNVNMQASVQHDAPTDDILAGVQVGLQIPVFNRNQGAIRQARAEINAAELNISRLELALRERLAEAFRQYANSSFEVNKYVQQILPTSEKNLDLVTRGYRQGEVGYLDQLAAQRTFFETNLSYIDSLRELWRAKLRIDGLLLEGSLQQGDGDPI